MPAFRHRAAHYVLKKLGFFDRSYSEDAFGSTFKIPIINGRKTYISEPWMADMIRRLFAIREGAFIDVGVNLGQTMLKVAAADKTRFYLGFEPNPACADYASELAVANRINGKIIPAGIGRDTAVLALNFYRDEDTDPSASLVPGFRQGVTHSVPVVVLSPSALPTGLMPDTIAVIKIDVEGGEADVVEGLVPFLRDCRPFLLMEILPAYSVENHERIARQLRIEGILRDLRYAIYRIARNKSDGLLGVKMIQEIGIQSDLLDADYLMVPQEDIELVGSAMSVNSD